MRKCVMAAALCAFVTGCGSDKAPATDDIEAAAEQARDYGRELLDNASNATDDAADALEQSGRDALDAAAKAAEDLEEAARKRAEEAAQQARQARADAEQAARDQLAKLEAEREALRKQKGDFQREIRVGEEEN